MIRRKFILACLIFVIALAIIVTQSFKDKDNKKQIPTPPVSKEPIQEPIEEEKLFMLTTDLLNLRKGPGIDYEKILVMPKGAKVEVVGEENNWYQVLFEGQTGFCFGDYLENTN